MSHDISIPTDLHDGAVASVKDALGSFWSSVFRDQDLVDALLSARVMAAGQKHIDAMEALSLRDHENSPVLHREHWHPMAIRLSKRDTASVMRVGMPDTPVVGEQPDDEEVYLPNEVFVVGGNALYSKVYTYQIEGAEGSSPFSVATALCDSVSSPKHMLSQGRDFTIDDGVLAIRKEKDPFETDGYLVEDDGDDKVAVLWACDAEFDRDNVADFLGYPLGLHAPSTSAASTMLSALWDAITLGLTPVSLARILGAVFDVPAITRDAVVESVEDAGSDKIVVTDDFVYRISAARLPESIVGGCYLKAGSFLTDELSAYWGLSADDIASLEAEGLLGRVYLPPGSVAGVDDTVVIEPRDSAIEDGWWFKLSDGDSVDSPFWRAVFSRTTQAEREEFISRMSKGSGSIDPLRAIGPVVLANLILVRTSRSPMSDMCAGLTLDFLHRIVPAFSSLLLVQDVDASDGNDTIDVSEGGDSAEHAMARTNAVNSPSDDGVSIEDSSYFRLVPIAATEV